ncbi:MAG: flagellar biosynthesis protein FlhF [Peptostreptococcaceae bacterium]|nr:flagellar biosynthesis protein FlhF [Peptostreptococcaceae bacterium]
MNIKKFTGKSMNEIMAQVQTEFGDNAMIIQSKKIKTGGLFGLFAKEEIEVLAAADARKSGSSEVKKNGKSRKYKEVQQQAERKNEALSREMPESPVFESIEERRDSQRLKEEIEEIKAVVKQLNSRFTKAFISEEEERVERRKAESVDRLRSLGISQSLSEELVASLASGAEEYTTKNLIAAIDKRFGKICSKGYNSIGEKYNVFVGPTGVGKTTTLAKLASGIAIRENRKIGFLTLDTYRISAVEQLKTYAEILNSPIEVAYDVSDVEGALLRLANRDVLFIDTAGRSHKNRAHMKELKETLDGIQNKNVFLVVSANHHIDDIKNLIERYDFLEDFHLIVTKLDETDRAGLILDIMDFCRKAPVFLTYGQNVPDDIEEFQFDKFVNELFMESKS